MAIQLTVWVYFTHKLNGNAAIMRKFAPFNCENGMIMALDGKLWAMKFQCFAGENKRVPSINAN